MGNAAFNALSRFMNTARKTDKFQGIVGCTPVFNIPLLGNPYISPKITRGFFLGKLFPKNPLRICSQCKAIVKHVKHNFATERQESTVEDSSFCSCRVRHRFVKKNTVPCSTLACILPTDYA